MFQVFLQRKSALAVVAEYSGSSRIRELQGLLRGWHMASGGQGSSGRVCGGRCQAVVKCLGLRRLVPKVTKRLLALHAAVLWSHPGPTTQSFTPLPAAALLQVCTRRRFAPACPFLLFARVRLCLRACSCPCCRGAYMKCAGC
jgi:hypothetical protein